MLDLGVRTATECFMATGSYNTYRRRRCGDRLRLRPMISNMSPMAGSSVEVLSGAGLAGAEQVETVVVGGEPSLVGCQV